MKSRAAGNAKSANGGKSAESKKSANYHKGIQVEDTTASVRINASHMNAIPAELASSDNSTSQELIHIEIQSCNLHGRAHFLPFILLKSELSL